MNILQKLFFILALLAFNGKTLATWYQGSAQQPIHGFNIDKIRAIAIKKAIANASLQSNSFIKSEDISLNGLLQSSKTILRSEGQIRRVEILSESISDDILTVRVNVDIKTFWNCDGDNFTKKILITQFPLLKQSQAAHGGIFDFGSQVSKRFEQQLLPFDDISEPQLIDKSLLPPNSFQQISRRDTAKIAHFLGNEYSSQFILFGFIRDMSLFEQTKEKLIFDESLIRRNFTLQLYLYDIFKDAMLLQESYHGEANWQYKANDTVDTYNSVFWRSDYGRVVLNTISNAVIDVTDKLKCQQSLAQVIEIGNDQIVINIGAQQGVKISDNFELVKQRTIIQPNGDSLSILNEDNQRVFEVKQLGHKFTILTSKSLSLVANTHLNDLIQVKTFFKPK